jgi:DNA-binding transcriptional LysR family regulator
VVPAKHKFSKLEGVSVPAAAAEPFLFFDRNSSYHSLVYTMFLRSGVAPESVMECDSMEAIKHMVERGLGVAVLPEVSVEEEVTRGVLATVDLTGIDKPMREVGLHVLRNRMMAPPIGDFLQLMAQHYRLNRTFEAGQTPGESR